MTCAYAEGWYQQRQIQHETKLNLSHYGGFAWEAVVMAAVTRNTSDSDAEAQLIYALTLPVSCAIILTNLLLILAIACSRQLHSPQNYFFVSLLVADLCTGVALPFIPWMGLNRPLSFCSCLLVHIFPNFLFLAFLSNLVLVHYERYRSIVSPLRHGQLWLHRRFALALLAAWMLPLLFALLPAFGWNNKLIHDRNGCCPETNSTAQSNCAALSGERCCTYRSVFPNAFIYLEVYGLLAPAILSIAAMTCRVLWITREQLRDIQRLQRAVANKRYRRRLEMRYACCVAAVSLAFLACWVPYIVYTHIGMEFLLRRGGKSDRTGHIVLSCVGVGGVAVVPLLLGLANREYTDPVGKLFRKLRHRCRNTSVQMDSRLRFCRS
ncbi:G-protein coupled bile acid receptor 1 isoform X1 [Pimephales promelas]|uniref:G-protein coupled bile acid receptor 1 isoform X1 n=2 Tax=Pimephales promelas TaxID=90988 RepID=UPI00195555E0|nr:G-protein coupled bile acid receptor 1 isoform X1 [Pimephales promelas]